MSIAVDIFSGILFVRTRHYDDIKKVVVLQGNKPERRFFEEQPQGEWIKTSEKNPKRSGFYITTCEDICCRNIRVCGYDAVQKKWSRGGVVAWMPLPKPYKEEGESDADS